MSMPSVQIAKERLQNLLSADRMQCTPDMMEKMSSDIFHTLEKYISIDPETFEMKITRTDIQIKYTGEYD